MRRPWLQEAVVLVAVVTLLSAYLLLHSVVRASPPVRPNVILIITDDQDVESLNYMPNVRALLAERGTTFDNMFITNPLCCPSHVSFLTGRYPHNTGVLNNTFPTGGFRRFRDSGGERSTIATWLQDAGYRTARFGKYLIEYESTTYVPPGWSEWYAFFGAGKYFDYTLNENGREIRYGTAPGDYSADVLARKVAEFIDRVGPAESFFVIYAPAAPHAEVGGNGPPRPAPRHGAMFAGATAPRPPSFNEADVSDKPPAIRNLPLLTPAQIAAIDSEYRMRLQSLQAVDEGVQRIIATLAAARRLDDTYIFFTSDNGYHLGQHRLRNGKNQIYEEDIRVPLVVRGPGVPVGVALEHFVLNIDFAPTIAELAGVRPGHTVDGQSFVDLLADRPPSPYAWRRDFLIEIYRGLSLANTDAVRALRSVDGELYAEYEAGPIELYDLRQDPHQLDSLHDLAQTAYLRRLAYRLGQLAVCAGENCRR